MARQTTTAEASITLTAVCSLTTADGGFDPIKNIFPAWFVNTDPDLRICQPPYSRALNETGVTPRTPREQPENSGNSVTDLSYLSSLRTQWI